MSTRFIIILGLFFFKEGIAQQKNPVGKKLILTIEMKTSMENADPLQPSESKLSSLITTINTITEADGKAVSMDVYIKRLAGSKTFGETLQTYDTDDGAILYHPALREYLPILNKSAVLVFKEDKIQQKEIPLLDKMAAFSGNTGIFDEYRELILTNMPGNLTAGYHWTKRSKQDNLQREANYSVTKITDTSIEVNGIIGVNGNRTVISNGSKNKIQLDGKIQMTAYYDPATFLLKKANYQAESTIKEEAGHSIRNFIAHSTRVYSVKAD